MMQFQAAFIHLINGEKYYNNLGFMNLKYISKLNVNFLAILVLDIISFILCCLLNKGPIWTGKLITWPDLQTEHLRPY